MKQKLIDPTQDFIEAIKHDCNIRGKEIAGEHFDGDMADVMGEVFGDILANGVMYGIGNSLYDVPMK